MLLNWFKNWLTRRKRCVFSYFDGHAWRQADPYVVWVALLEDEVMEMEIDIPAMDRGDIDSTRKVVGAVMRAFNLQPMGAGGSGVTFAECRALLARFLRYAQLLKKNSDLTLMLSATSDGTPSMDPSPKSDDSEST